MEMRAEMEQMREHMGQMKYHPPRYHYRNHSRGDLQCGNPRDSNMSPRIHPTVQNATRLDYHRRRTGYRETGSGGVQATQGIINPPQPTYSIGAHMGHNRQTGPTLMAQDAAPSSEEKINSLEE
ncbi:hypothetical protein CR513_37748, partial [Mucuna pruriens]